MKRYLTFCLLVAVGLTTITGAADSNGPREVDGFFNGTDLTGWKADDMSFWSVKDGAIVGTGGDEKIPRNLFLWHETSVSDFYLSLKVKQMPYKANAGIQFRSEPTEEGAYGYQADAGAGWWGVLYHEHGRRLLARSADVGGKNVKREDWNHYEILAVGHRIWLALNGKITVALRDKAGELKGQIAVQIHKGGPQEVAYKDFKLIHDPKVELLGMDEEQLHGLLVEAPYKKTPTRRNRKKPGSADKLEKTSSAITQKKPNVIIMMVDDMGFAGPSIAPYSNPNYKTPGMNRLAREGMRFDAFYSSGTVCTPTRVGLLTGRYQQRSGIEAVIHPGPKHPEHNKWLKASEVTFAELFQQAGYATGLVGKWHLGYPKENPEAHPQNHGFGTFIGYHSGNVDYINHWGDHGKHDWWHGRKETKEEGYSTHLITKHALTFIEEHKAKPFCLYVAHESPHYPLQGPNDPPQRGPGKAEKKTSRAESLKQMVLEMDTGVEQIRAKLVELGIDKNTLVFFFSDNGVAKLGIKDSGSTRFRGHKENVYEGGTRVPAIAWWPGKIQPNTLVDEPCISIDVMPTILSVAGIKPPSDLAFDGIDLSPRLFDQKQLPHRSLFWASLSNKGERKEAIRDGWWKLVVQHPGAKPGTFENEQVELYNLQSDESETNDLSEQQPERAAEMLQRIKDWYADTQKTATPQPGGWLTPDTFIEIPQKTID